MGTNSKIGNAVVIGSGVTYYSKEKLNDKTFVYRANDGTLVKKIQTKEWIETLFSHIWNKDVIG
jgi:hypothetical protein